MSDETEYMNAVQAAAYLGVRRQRVYELVEDGRLGRKIAGYWVFTQQELDAYKEQRIVNKGGRPPKITSVPALS